MRITALVAAVVATLAVASTASGGPTLRELLPGVTYTRETELVNGRPIVVHTVTAPQPQPGGLYELKPILSNGTITDRETVTDMQRRLSGRATVVGINGDLFNVDEGFPSGMFMRDGVLHGRPVSSRSTLGIGLDGLLRIARIGFFGTWGVGDAPREQLDHLNRPLEPGEAGLYTTAWGPSTPLLPGAVDIVVTGLPATTPNVDLTGAIAAVSTGGGAAIPADGAVLQVTPQRAGGLASLAQPGQPLVVKLILKPFWDQVQDAIGGGPALVRRSQVALPTTEAFTSGQLLPRHSRSAVGQLADGRILLLTVDGSAAGSAGVTMRQLAELLIERGAVTAMALDGGSSSTLAFDGSLLNRPDGGERAVADALMVLYYGVYAPEPTVAVWSPNGDGVDDLQRLSYGIVRPSTVDVQLLGAGGQVAWADAGAREPGTYPVPDDVLATLTEGGWRIVATATDQLGITSNAERSFSVNSTLGHLSVSKQVLKLRKRGGGSVAVGFRVAHPARVVVTVEDSAGAIVRTVYAVRDRKPGDVLVSWNGRNGQGTLVPRGRYVIRVLAANGLGEVALARPLTVKRV